MSTVYEILKGRAKSSPESIAILAPGRKPLSYGRLLRHLAETLDRMNGMGLGRGDRVAIVLPSGPEAVTALLAVAAGSACVPLNPALGASELALLLSRSKANALLTQPEIAPHAVDAARTCGVPVIQLLPASAGEAGPFHLHAEKHGRAACPGIAQPGELAVLLPTSGTTSLPKIIPLTQTDVCIHAQRVRSYLELTAADRSLNLMPPFHSGGLMPMLGAFFAGGETVFPPGMLAHEFFRWMEEFRPTWCAAVPPAYEILVPEASRRTELLRRMPLRLLFTCGAPLPQRTVAALEEAFHVPLQISYGASECGGITLNPMPPGVRKAGSAGNTVELEIAVMDDAGGILRAGETGEVVVRGPGVFRGYEDEPEANAHAFRDGWFRTGDQGYLDGDGYLFLTGRLKELINRGSEKIAPREVEEALLQHTAVAEAAAFAVPHPQLGEDVAAAVVLSEGATATAEEIRAFAAQRLADFKLPRVILLAPEIPKGAGGKVQRVRLAETFAGELVRAGRRPDTAFVPPRTPEEQTLAGIWAEVLGLERVGIHDSFTELGGHSLQATQIAARASVLLGAQVPVRFVLEAPTVAEQALAIVQARAEPAAAAWNERPIPRRTAAGPRPLSFAQERLWFLDQLEPSSPVYNETLALRLSGKLDLAALEKTLDAIVVRHEVLRTTFVSIDGSPVQVVTPNRAMELAIIELEPGPDDDREREIRRLVLESSRRPFDLSRDLMLRALLLRLQNHEHILALSQHHIAFDGWSAGVLLREFQEMYTAFAAGSAPALPELPIQYADYAEWQREWLQGDVLEKQLSYWTRQLGGVSALSLPADHPRPPSQTYRGARESFVLPASLCESLRALGRAERATLFMTLLAAFQVLLHRYTGQTDICVGSPIANRTKAETEALIGFFANTLVLRADLGGDPTFREALARVRGVTLDAYSHQDLPFEKLVEALQPQRSLSYSPLFQVMLAFQNAPSARLELPGSEASVLDIESGAAKFDLLLSIEDTASHIKGWMEYSTDLFEAPSIRRMLGHFQTLLDAATENPDLPISRLPVLTSAERSQLLVEWNDTRDDSPLTCVHELFEAQVDRSPEAAAVVCESGRLSYRELYRRANQLARHLQGLGVGPDVLAGILIERSLEMIVSVLGVLKAGGACVPLDPYYPRERLDFMLRDAAPSVLLTYERLGRKTPFPGGRTVILDSQRSSISRQSAGNPGQMAGADNAAYVIYTSGSTGKPKGVVMNHRPLANLVGWQLRCLNACDRARVLQFAPLSFDVAFQEIFSTLCSGGTLIVAPEELRRDPAGLLRFISDENVTRLFLPFVVLQHLAETLDGSSPPAALREIITAGEQLRITPAIVRLFEALPGCTLNNQYGPTESHVATSYMLAGPPSAWPALPPIGRPIANTRIYVLDGRLQQAPVGVPGEIHIGGGCLARGYLNRPELTAEKFVPSPFPEEKGSRLYRTGDVARYLPDGNIEFLGRLDDQVKISGFRVELGEIEAALTSHDAVEAAAVAVSEDAGGDKRLAAYFIGRRQRSVNPLELRDFLTRTLPDYMVPSFFVPLNVLPLLPSGKVDRKALPPPGQSSLAPAKELAGPRDAVEFRLMKIWESTLGVPAASVEDDFFEQGGHSLLAARLMARIERTFGKRLPVVTLFQAPTVEQLAARLRASEAAPSPGQIAVIQPAGSKHPFFCVFADLFMRVLAHRLDQDRPFLDLYQSDPCGLSAPYRLEDIAANLVRTVCEVQPEGPYYLGGWCRAGVLALEVAQQLRARAKEVALLVLFDSHNPAYLRGLSPARAFQHRTRYLLERVRFQVAALREMRAGSAPPYLKARMRTFLSETQHTLLRLSYRLQARDRAWAPTRGMEQIVQLAVGDYTPQSYAGRVVLFRGAERPGRLSLDFKAGWGAIAASLDVQEVPGGHYSMFLEPNVATLARKLFSLL